MADISTIVYDFTGQVLRSTSVHFKDASTSVKLKDSTLYDHAGRVTHRYRRMDNEAAFQLVSQYEYNALGQLVDKKLHKDGSGNFVQSIDYRYTIRGWLKSINNSQLSSDNGVSNDETNDLFGEELLYNTVQSGLSNTPLYNGNITAVMWKTASMGQATQELTSGQRAYKFTYDKSDKMLSAIFAARDTSTSWNKQVNTLNESATYDHNGNILSLLRYQNNRSLSGTMVGSAAKVLDNLVYTHATGNQLTKVEDRSGNTEGFKNVNNTTEYTYNTAGSQTKDDNKGISTIAYNVLGKPLTVNFTSGKKVEYIYDASGGKRTVKVYQGATLETTTDYSGGFVYESGTLSFFSSPEGRVVKNGSSYEYQYAIADHQGNTRVMFSGTTPAPTAITATFEGGGSDNANLFSNVDAGKVESFTAANHTPSGSKAIRMNQTYRVGPSKSIKVYPGDKIDAKVWAYYEGSSGYTGTPTVAAMVTAVASAFGGASGGGGESGSIYDGVNSALGGFGLGGDAGNNAPAAYLNYIQFDQQYKVLNMGYERVKASTYSLDSIYLTQIQIKEPGFVFVYLSYEDESNNWVYFDDFKVTHTKSNIVQANEYYPFGMQTASSWTRENATDNKFLANGGTELNKTTGNYDLEFRNYDPVLARMNQVDPMAAKYASQTPYNYSFNNPVSLNDPNGADPYNHSPGTSFHGGYYTYDDIVPNKYPDAMAYSGRQGVMGVAGWGGYGRSGIFDGFNSLVNSTVANNNAKEALANNIVNGIADALAGGDGTYAVNPSNGIATNLGSELGTSLLTAMDYHSLHGTTSLISNLSVMESGVLGTGERYYNFRLRGATADDPMSHYAAALSSSGKAEYMEMYSGSIKKETQGGVLQAGIELPLGLFSAYSFGSMAYNEARSYGLAKNAKAMFQEYNSIRNFNKGYKVARQAQLLTNISNNLNAFDVIKAGSKRMAFIGLAVGAMDVVDKGFTTESMALYGFDAAMTGVAFLGPIGAGVAAIYFTGRFAYDLYQMSQDGK